MTGTAWSGISAVSQYLSVIPAQPPVVGMSSEGPRVFSLSLFTF